MLALKNILVPIDFSVNSIQAFEFGLILAKPNNSFLHLMHVIDSFFYSENKYDDLRKESLREIRYRNAEEELKKFIYEVPRNDVKVIEVLVEGVPHSEILNYAQKNSIDLIVIASHGWTNLSTTMTGNIANKVFRYSDIPVVCVKLSNSLKKRSLQEFITHNHIA
jgi:nucleotide-binding universal stress UspA family protein